jgi:hypothetical protein
LPEGELVGEAATPGAGTKMARTWTAPVTTAEVVVAATVFVPTRQPWNGQSVESVGRSLSSTLAPQGTVMLRLAPSKTTVLPETAAVTEPQTVPEVAVMLTVSWQPVPGLA